MCDNPPLCCMVLDTSCIEIPSQYHICHLNTPVYSTATKDEHHEDYKNIDGTRLTATLTGTFLQWITMKVLYILLRPFQTNKTTTTPIHQAMGFTGELTRCWETIQIKKTYKKHQP
ncbi:hypothetical protein JB92DRAFT_2207641 [Gautieria morchelliformis]|nr:hypothetical protein JB92DRAFT_2207641 [Gautieria morchelliformis]